MTENQENSKKQEPTPKDSQEQDIKQAEQLLENNDDTGRLKFKKEDMWIMQAGKKEKLK